MQDQNNHKYDDIIHLEHPVSKAHPQMSLYDRAAQFAPFAALTGHAAAIRETARRTDEKRMLSDEVLEELNEKLNIISANIGTEQLVDITYFVQDERKAGGEYVTHSGIVKRIDLYRRAVIMADATIIPIEDISRIESNLFSGLE